MTSPIAANRSHTTAETRSGEVPALVFCLSWKTFVAFAPVSAARASSSVSRLMSGLLRLVRSAVLAVAGELLQVDLHPEPGSLGDPHGAVLDDEGFGEQVAGHVQVVGQLAGPTRSTVVRGAEDHGAQGPQLAVDLI